MTNRIYYVIYLILLASLIMLMFGGDFLGENIKIVKTISYLDAQQIIEDEYLDYHNIEEETPMTDSIYTIVKIPIKNYNATILSVMIKTNHTFHVFQNNHLIYSQLQDEYYQGFSRQVDTYNMLGSESLQGKVLHDIILYSHDPIYLLIKVDVNQNIKQIVSTPKITPKNIQHLIKTQIPIIKINTHHQGLSTKKYNYISSEFILQDSVYTKRASMKIRGNTSLSFPKKKFNVVFKEPGKLNNITLKQNVLVSAFNDKSLMRNKIPDALFPAFKQSSTYVHLIINDFYEGLYLLREHPETQFKKLIKDKNNLNFLLKIDRGPYDFYANSKNGYICEYPEFCHDEIKYITRLFENDIKLGGIQAHNTFVQKIKYIKNQFGLDEKMAKSIIRKADEIMDPANTDWLKAIKEKARENGNHFYHQLLKDSHWLLNKSKNNYQNLHFSRIDTTSFIDFIVLNELSKNIDAYRLSSYLSYINNQFKIDIIWDFDLSWGLANYNDGFNHENFIIESDLKEHIPVFWHNLWNDKFFQEKLKNRYQKLRLSILSNKAVENSINNIYTSISPSAKINFERWEIIEKNIWPNKFNFKTYEEEIEYLQKWSSERLKWLDSKWLDI